MILALFGRVVHSQICSDPVRDYLKKNANLETGEILPGEAWTGHAGDQPPGGYLLRFEAPIGPNGSPVLFVCLSVLSNQTRSAWGAYTNLAKARYMLASDGVDLGSIPSFYLLTHNKAPGIAAIYAGKKSISVTTYSTDSSGHLLTRSLPGVARDQDAEDANPKVEEEEDDALLQKYKLNKRFVPKIEMVLLAEYLRNPSVAWRPFNRNFGVTSQHADPNEKRAADAAQGFTQEQASGLFKALRN